jgi:hypothetical protein
MIETVVQEEANTFRVDVRTPQVAGDYGKTLVQQLAEGEALLANPESTQPT